jgi:hypothetical protein
MAGAVSVPSRGDTSPINPGATGRRGHGAGGGIRIPFGAASLVGRPRFQAHQNDADASQPGGSLHYARPYYVNDGAARSNSSPVNFNPYTSSTFEPGPMAAPPHVSDKRIDMGTERREFGSWSQSYPHGAMFDTGVLAKLAKFGATYGRPTLSWAAVPRTPAQPSAKLRNFGMKAQMSGPYYPLLTTMAQASSYGSQTKVLPATGAQQASLFTGSVYGA